MQAKLINYSQSSFNQEPLNLLEQIAFCARVSNPGNQMNTETSEKLVRYLIKHQHWSPLEMVSACLEIETTRDIARQILRHRSFSFQEFSQRYAVADLGWNYKEARIQDYQNRQNSISLNVNENAEHRKLAFQWSLTQENVVNTAIEAYEWALNNGIAKEQARAVLPEGITVSRLYMNGTLRSWVHYIQLRSGNGTQKEHRDVAIACAEALEPVFPMIMEFVEKE